MKTQIQPVAIFPGKANTLYLRGGSLGPPPTFYYELQAVTPGKHHKSKPGVPAFADPDVVDILKNGNVEMTAEQWADWKTQPDDAYMLKCAAEILKLEIVK